MDGDEEEVDFGEGEQEMTQVVPGANGAKAEASWGDNLGNGGDAARQDVEVDGLNPVDANYSHVVNPALLEAAMVKARARADRFGGAVVAPDPFRIMMEQASDDLLLKNHGDVRTAGPITQLLGSVSSNPEFGGNTVVVWGTMPRTIGRCSLNIAIGQDHETFLVHFNPRFHRVKKYSRVMLGTKREYVWDASGDELKRMPMAPGERFEWRCTVCRSGFAFFVNGKFLWKYSHRVSPNDITEPLQLHVPNDKDNDNLLVHAVWWGHKDDSQVDRLENPTNEVSAIVAGFDLMSEEEQQKMAERAARFGGNAEAAENALTPEQQAEMEKRRAREERFGLTDEKQSHLDRQEAAEKIRAPRREVPENIKRRKNVLHLYGVDNISTADIKIYFNGHNILGIRWLDGSSCNLQFIDEFEAKRALLGVLTPEAKAAAKDAGKDVFGYTWLECRHYRKEQDDSYGISGDEIDLFGRLATVHDVSARAMDPPMQYHGEGSEKPKPVGQQRFDQLMSSYGQNRKNRRRKRRLKGATRKGNAVGDGNPDFSEYD
jgi:hypothetical protein